MDSKSDPITNHDSQLTNRRHLGVDYGTRRVGLAMSDEGGTFVSPLEVVEVTTPAVALEKVSAVVAKEDVGIIVVGLPINMDGTEGPSAKAVRAWVKSLREATKRSIVLVDERQTSVEAEQSIVDRKRGGEKITRKGKKKRLDALAAAVILKGYLDGDLAVLSEPDSRADATGAARRDSGDLP